MENQTRKWWLVDARDQILGRLASNIATILMGKSKPTYSPHLDEGDFVVVVNADKIRLTGKKAEAKVYYHHTFYPGGLKEVPFKSMLERHPDRILYLAVKNMLPKNKLRIRRLKRLKLYASALHPHKAQKPLPLEIGGT
ncbi:50S ribosomal protein L13 [candidate division WOR-3 bacterium]|nr:50S ribosomal protein L13 [candidate division WOR-3 bacterium]